MWFMALCFIYKQMLLLNCQKFMVNFSISFVIFFALKNEGGHIGQEPILPIHKVALSFPQGQKKHSSKQSKKQPRSGNDTCKSSQKLLVCVCSGIDTSYLMQELHIL